MPFQNVATKNDQIWPFCLDLRNALGQPTPPKQAVKVQVGGEYKDRTVALTRQMRELHFVTSDHWSTPRLHDGDLAKRQARHQCPAAKRRSHARQKQPEPGDQIGP